MLRWQTKHYMLIDKLYFCKLTLFCPVASSIHCSVHLMELDKRIMLNVLYHFFFVCFCNMCLPTPCKWYKVHSLLLESCTPAHSFGCVVPIHVFSEVAPNWYPTDTSSRMVTARARLIGNGLALFSVQTKTSLIPSQHFSVILNHNHKIFLWLYPNLYCCL